MDQFNQAPAPTQEEFDDAIGELSDRIDYYTLANAQAITTGYVTYTNFDSRKFSDYGMLEFTPIVEGWLRNSIVIPSSVFKTSTGIALYFHSGSNVIEVDIKWKSDTTYEAKYIGTLSQTCYLYCHGWVGFRKHRLN